MKRKVLTGIAAAMLSAMIPMSSTTGLLAEETTAPPEQIVEKEFDREKMPQMNGERPEFNGERPEFNGERPEFNGEMPEFNGEMPEFNGEMPEGFGNGKAPGKGRMPRKSDEEALAEGTEKPELPKEFAMKKPFGRRRMPKKSDEEAMKENNAAPELPEDVTAEENN